MNAWTDTIGWTLIHFVWQGAWLALATGVALRLLRGRAPQARYAVATLGLVAMLTAPLITAAALWQQRATGPAANTQAPLAGSATWSPAVPSTTALTAPRAGARGTPAADVVLATAVWVWMAGVLVLGVRLAGGWWRVQRIKAACLRAGASPWQQTAERLAGRLQLTIAFRVVESAIVSCPTVIGLLRPVILLPAAVVTNLTPLQIEALLAHELAHIRRHDYAVNLLQSVAESLLFFHPGVWWVSAAIRAEREHCCDDVAVEICGEPRAYAAALATLASWQSREFRFAPGASGGSLLGRVRRLLRVHEDHEARSLGGLVVFAIAISVAAGAALQAFVARVPDRPSIRGATATPASGPAIREPAIPASLAPEERRVVPALRAAAARGSLAPAQPVPAPARRTRSTDHFEIAYPADLDLHAERVAVEAERGYAQISADLRHNLAERVTIVLFRTTQELEQAGPASSGAVPSDDRVRFAVDQPADQWFGRLVHEITHVFTFDILPGNGVTPWIAEGLAEFERRSWDPRDLVALRAAVRDNAVHKLASLPANTGDAGRLTLAIGHAAFDFIESRLGMDGIRRFLFALRRASQGGGDPFEAALMMTRDAFDEAFQRYLKERFAAVAAGSLSDRFDERATLSIEGEIIAIRSDPPSGLACLELWVARERGARERWGIECGRELLEGGLNGLEPGDRVIVTGAPARRPVGQRIYLRSLTRASTDRIEPRPGL